MAKTVDPNIRILSPELRERVMKATLEAFTKAAMHFKVEFTMPEVRFDIKSRVGGLAAHSGQFIRYNLILLFENEDHFIENVVPHEVAHIVNNKVSTIPDGKKKLMPHGKEWKKIMVDVYGLKPNVFHNYDCSSIESRPKKRKTSRQRVDGALKIIDHVLRRVDKKFTTAEQIRFRNVFDQMVEELREAA